MKGLVSEFSGKCDYVDARVFEVKRENIFLENGETSNSFLHDKSYGVRVLYKGGWGLVHSYDFSEARDVFSKALRIAKLSSSDLEVSAPSMAEINRVYPANIDVFSVDPVDKIKLLRDFDQGLSDEVVVSKTLLLQNEQVTREVFTPNSMITQSFSNNIFRANVTGKQGSVIQSTGKNYAQLGGFEVIKKLGVSDVCSEVLDRLNRLLSAKAPKPERASIVCDPGMTGLFFHEAVGHACEADAVLNSASVLKGKVGELIASPEVNLLDDPTIKERGFYWFDDEGVAASPTTLIKDGVLKGFLHSLRTAGLMGVEPSGNGRCMSPGNYPIPRMSNTVLEKGEWRVPDLLKEVSDGYYIKGFGGGVVDPITGQFSFAASECFKVEGGEVSEPLRDVTLSGDILSVLKKIRVGRDLSMTQLTGTCGKMGQGVRVGEQCPSIMVEEVVVGGS